MKGPFRTLGLWALSLAMLGAVAVTFGWVISFSRTPLSTPVELGGAPDFDPATPQAFAPASSGTEGAAAGLVRLAFLGDIMQHPEQRGDDFSRTYEAIEPALRDYDLVVGNLEFPVDPSQPPDPFPGQIRFNGSSENVRALAGAGVDLVTTANNHCFDMGYEGVLSTLDVIRAEGMEAFGTAGTLDEIQPKIVEVGQHHIAFVTYTFPPNVYTDEAGRPIPWPRDWPVRDLYFDDWSGEYREQGRSRFAADVEAARRAEADFIIAFVHWGQEWKYAPDRHQRLAARDMMESGIDLVIGSHSHVLNPAEWVDGRLVAYSLGNFVSAFGQWEVRTSAVLEVSLVEGEDAALSVGDFAFHPILTSGRDHQVHPIMASATGEARRALELARKILGEDAVRPFPPPPTVH